MDDAPMALGQKKEIAMLAATIAMTALLAAPVAAGGPAPAEGLRKSNTVMCAHCAASRAAATRPGWEMTRRDNPHSTVIEDDSTTVHTPTNEEINAAETGNTYSADFSYDNASGPGTGNLDLEALEVESPHNAQPGRRAALTALAGTSSATKCRCTLSEARASAR